MNASTLRIPAAAALLATLATGLPVQAATYEISSRESRVRFEIGHEHYAKKVRGRFDRLGGTIEFDIAQTEQVAVDVVIDTDSIATANRHRDSHLREAFFQTDDHPTATFTANELVSEGESLRLIGQLTLRGITESITLELSGAGHSLDAEGRGVLRYRAKTSFDRRAFGVEEDAERSSGLKKVLAQVQEGLDELISDEVELKIFLVARER